MKNITEVYRYPWSYAVEHGEEALFRESLQANIACKEAIEQAINHRSRLSDSGFGTTCDIAAAVASVLKQFTLERIAYVLANTIQKKNWDARFSHQNKRWAALIPMFSADVRDTWQCRFVVDTAHALLVNAFTDRIREKCKNKSPFHQ